MGNSSCLNMKPTSALLILITIAMAIKSAHAIRILEQKPVQNKYLANLNLFDGEHNEIQNQVACSNLNIQLDQRLFTAKNSSEAGQMKLVRPHKKIITLKNKLPSGPSPGVGHAYVNAGPVKTSWEASILKNKLPSGPSPGVGHAYINAGPLKMREAATTILKNKLPSGPSPGVGH